MEHSIKRVGVIGAGTMGAAIAAHVANAGLPVLLLDIAPGELSPAEEKKGLALDHPKVRNRIVTDGLRRIEKLQPPSFMGQQARQLVRSGNLEDDFQKLADCDWIIEAIVERLDVKRDLMERIDQVRGDHTLVTTNTSGLPIGQISEGRSESFRKHFFGTHFFNPPRYMHLVEIIRGEEADPIAVSGLADLIIRKLGKGVVFCKDTPNFIANRLLSVHGSFVIEYGLENGYRIEEVDALTGPLMGRPKTATFRLQDLVGIDVAHHVASNLYEQIPKDPYSEVLQAPNVSRVINGLLERGRAGNKTGSGFYRKTKAKGGSKYQVLDPETFEYRPAEDVQIASLAAVRKIRDLGPRLRAILDDEWRNDRGARLVWAVIGHYLGYAADVARDISYDLASVDRAVRWGFGYDVGPFELWDLLGVEETAARMEASGIEVADWVKEMLFAELDSFYRHDDGWVTGYYDWQTQAHADLLYDEQHLKIEDLRKTQAPLASNGSASLHDMGDGVLLLEFHAKMNAIDGDIVAMMGKAREFLAEDAYYGLVIGNDGPNFCVGANLQNVGQAALAGDFDGIKESSKAFQDALQAFRFGSKPVVAAVHGMALGGGAEIALGVSRIVAHAESYVGLVEVGVGLVPGGGGLKELARRLISPGMERPESDPLPAAQQVLETVAMAKVSGSAAEARELGFLGPRDRIVMLRDHLLHEAKQEVLSMNAEGYLPPAPAPVYAGGRDLLAALEVAVWSLEQAGYASEHDALIARKIAFILTGGDASQTRWISEEDFLRLEREAFADLVATEKTQARIRQMLETGKPLRN